MKSQYFDYRWKIREIGFTCADGTFSKMSPQVDIVQDRDDDGPGSASSVATNINHAVAEHIVALHNQTLEGGDNGQD